MSALRDMVEARRAGVGGILGDAWDAAKDVADAVTPDVNLASGNSKTNNVDAGADAEPSQGVSAWWYVGGAVALLALGGAGWAIWGRRHNPVKTNQKSDYVVVQEKVRDGFIIVERTIKRGRGTASQIAEQVRRLGVEGEWKFAQGEGSFIELWQGGGDNHDRYELHTDLFGSAKQDLLAYLNEVDYAEVPGGWQGDEWLPMRAVSRRSLNPAKRKPGKKGSMQVQTLLFPRELFTKAQAKSWAKAHGFKFGKVDTTANYHRLRQQPPSSFGFFRTISFGDSGIKAVVGR